MSRVTFLTAIAVPMSLMGNGLRVLDVNAWQSLAARSQPSAPIEAQVFPSAETSTLTLGAKTLGEKASGERSVKVDRSELHDTFVPSPNQPPVFTRGFGTR